MQILYVSQIYNKQSHFVRSIPGNKYLSDFYKNANAKAKSIDPGYKKQVKGIFPQSVT